MPFHRKSPPILQTAQKGWGTLKIIRGVPLERNPGSWHESQCYIEESRKKKRIAYAEEFVLFGRGDAGVGR